MVTLRESAGTSDLPAPMGHLACYTADGDATLAPLMPLTIEDAPLTPIVAAHGMQRQRSQDGDWGKQSVGPHA